MEVFVNLIFTGKVNSNELSDVEILQHFRETSCEEFIRRLQTLKSIIHHYHWYEGYMGYDDNDDHCGNIETTKLRPFINGLNKIRKYFTVDDIVKYMSIDSELYFSEDFLQVYKKDLQVARELYLKYWNKIRHCDDWDIYSVSFSLLSTDSDGD